CRHRCVRRLYDRLLGLGLLRSRLWRGFLLFLLRSVSALGLCGLSLQLFLGLGLLIARHLNSDVTVVTLLAIRTALRSRTHATAILVSTHIDEARLDPKIVRINRDILLLGLVGRVGDRRIQALCDRIGRT